MEQTATDKALDVLFYLRDAGAARGITDISRALSLPKSSAHRMAATLTRRGLLEQDDRGHYRLGIGLLSLGMGFLNQEPAVVASRPILQGVAADLGETCFLVAARAGELVVLAKAEGSGVLRASPPVGTVVPVGATAAGKLYLAFAPYELSPAGEHQGRFTEATLEGNSLDAAVTAAAETGFSQNVDEWIEGLSVLAAPVFANGDLCGVIALAVPSTRLRDMNRTAAIARLTRAATELSARLEGRMTVQHARRS